MSLQSATAATPIARRTGSAARRRGRLLAALLLFAVLVDLSMLSNWYVVNHGFYDSDWRVFFRAAERLRAGGQPYTAVDQFFNPPPFLLLARASLPLGYLLSRLLWCVASAAMLCGAAELTARAMDWRPTTNMRLLGALYILLYAPTILLIPTASNTTAPVVLSYALAIWLFRREREGWGGAALCLAALVKPQLAFLTLPLLLYKRRWRAAAAYLALGLGTVALSLPLVGGVHTYSSFLSLERATSSLASSAPLWIRDIPGLHGAFLQAFPHSNVAGDVAYALSAILVAALAWYWRGPWQPAGMRFVAGWAMVPMVDLLAAPYAHSDDLVLLIVPAVVLYALTQRPWVTALPVSRWIVPALLGLYLAPVLVVYFRQHAMVPALLAALLALWLAAPLAEPGTIGMDSSAVAVR